MQPIIQYSPPRTGSTLCYNAIKSIAPNRRVIKEHRIEYRWFFCPIITTVRDPLEIIVSKCDAKNLEIDDENVMNIARQIKKPLASLKKIRFFPRTLVLEYNDFYNNHDFLIDRIASFLKVELDLGTREEFKAEFDVAKIYADNKDKSFLKWNSDTKLHGSHVSKDLGRPGKSEKLTTRQRAIAKSILEL